MPDLFRKRGVFNWTYLSKAQANDKFSASQTSNPLEIRVNMQEC